MKKIEDKFKKWIEWKFYKILYIGILVPLLVKEARNWVFQDFFISLVFLATAIILLLPLIIKVMSLLEWIESFDAE